MRNNVERKKKCESSSAVTKEDFDQLAKNVNILAASLGNMGWCNDHQVCEIFSNSSQDEDCYILDQDGHKDEFVRCPNDDNHIRTPYENFEGNDNEEQRIRNFNDCHLDAIHGSCDMVCEFVKPTSFEEKVFGEVDDLKSFSLLMELEEEMVSNEIITIKIESNDEMETTRTHRQWINGISHHNKPTAHFKMDRRPFSEKTPFKSKKSNRKCNDRMPKEGASKKSPKHPYRSNVDRVRRELTVQGKLCHKQLLRDLIKGRKDPSRTPYKDEKRNSEFIAYAA